MKKTAWIGVTAVLLLLLTAMIFHYRKTAPSRSAIAVAMDVQKQIASGASSDVLQKVALPAAHDGRTDAEKIEFLTKSLRGEISEDGLRVLLKKGEFGPLQEVFPDIGKEWANKAGVPASECVAFRLEKNGVIAELVIYTNATTSQLVRINNVAQLGQ